MHRITRHVTTFLAGGFALATFASAARGQAAPTGGPQPAAVTYIGSSGFLIEAGGKRILIDALFGGFPGGYTIPATVLEPLLAGRAPYDRIDVVLATHRHGDHFSAALVRQVLEANPGAVFVGPQDAAVELTGLESRVRSLEVPEGQRRTLEVNGVTVAAMPFSHGTPPAGRPGIVNLAYIVTVGGLKFLHTGDIDPNSIPFSYLQALGVPDERVDVAFVPHFLLAMPAAAPWVANGLRPRIVVASHLQNTGPNAPNAEQIRGNFPGAVVFAAEGERWTVR